MYSRNESLYGIEGIHGISRNDNRIKIVFFFKIIFDKNGSRLTKICDIFLSSYISFYINSPLKYTDSETLELQDFIPNNSKP